MSEIPEPASKRVVTWAESLRQEGVDRGVEKGIEKGIERGRTQEARRLLTAMLEQRFGALSESSAEKIAAATVEQAERWLRRLLDATSAEDALSDPA